jgi:transcription initiation factor TFIIB
MTSLQVKQNNLCTNLKEDTLNITNSSNTNNNGTLKKKLIRQQKINTNKKSKFTTKTLKHKKVNKNKIWKDFDIMKTSDKKEILKDSDRNDKSDIDNIDDKHKLQEVKLVLNNKGSKCDKGDNNNPTNDIDIDSSYNNVGIGDYCNLCKSLLAITEEGFYGCTNIKCGILYKDVLDETAEWRYYGSADNQASDPTRCGMPTNPLLTESSYGCKIICNNKSTYEMRKIRRYTEWQSMPYKEKSQYEEFQRIKTMASNAGIPKLIIDDALRYHKKISEEKTFRALNRDGIIAASIYISGRLNNFPRTAKEIAAIFHLDNTSATKGCKNALVILNKLENNMENNEKTDLCQTRPISFIERYCSKLNINKELTKVCQFVALKIEKNNIIPENTPHSVAAGIIYFVSQSCNLNISKKDIKNVSEISEVTINKCHKKLENYKTQLIPSVIINKYSSYA